MPKIVDHEQRRAEIAEFSAELIAEGGVEAATIHEIAGRFAATGLSCAILHDPRAYNKNAVEEEIERIVATSTARIG